MVVIVHDKQNRLIKKGSDVVLKRLHANHLEEIRKIRNSPYVQDRFIYRKYITKEDQLSWFNKLNTENDEYFTVFYKKKIIGLIYIKKIDSSSKQGEAGIFFREGIPASTISYQSSILLLDYYFSKYAEYQLKAQVLESNKIALRYNRSLGFEIESKKIVEIGKDQVKVVNLIIDSQTYYKKTDKIRNLIFE
jgi:RimJ/RimL family protein N-acetyltransferase